MERHISLPLMNSLCGKDGVKANNQTNKRGMYLFLASAWLTSWRADWRRVGLAVMPLSTWVTQTDC